MSFDMLSRQTIIKLKPLLCMAGIVVFAWWYGKKLGLSLNRGMIKSLHGLLWFPILLMLPLIFRKMGMFSLFCLVVVFFWAPVEISGLAWFMGRLASNANLVELGIYFLLAVTLFSNLLSPSKRWIVALKRFPFAPFCLYVVGGMIGYLYAKIFLHVPNMSDTFYKMRILLILPAALYFLCLYIIDSKEKAEKVIWIYLISSIFLGLILLFGQTTTDMITVSDYTPTSGRLSMMLQMNQQGPHLFHHHIKINPTTAAAIFSVIFAISFCFLLNRASRIQRVFALAIIVLSMAILIQSMGRSGIFSSFAAAGVIWYLSGYSHLSSKRKTLVYLILFLVASVSVSYYNAVTSEYDTYRRVTLEIFRNPLQAGSLISHLDLWKQSIPIIFTHPLGIGPNGLIGISGTYAELANPFGDPWGVHNLILYWLLFSGFIGTAGFLLLFIRFFRDCKRRLKSQDRDVRILSVVGIGIITAFFVNGIGSPVLLDSVTVTVLWIPLSVIMAAMKLPDTSSSEINKIK